ncbi:MAG TPA: cytochrome c oxidase assembly protein, partial [Ilumatobacteraceae bacterium]|nr:cytochrome c oxidase assembly protein [Ilumatobacteraceae bacterium]
VYSIRVIGPRAVGEGQQIVSRSNIGCFVGAMTLLFAASTWPIHQIGEDYLYSVHMLQHMMLSYFMPPLVLLATPTWLMRLLVGTGRTYRIVTFMTKPVVAAVVFNLVVMVTHIPPVVNAAVQNGPLHYSLHLLLVLTALLMWMPVVGPFHELRLSDAAKPIYLFLQSVVPTVPAAWLTFAEGVVYKHYNQPVRVWGISVTDDQQLAGAMMKIGGSIFLWALVVFYFFKRFATTWKEDNTYRRPQLTFDQVKSEFDASSAPTEKVG